MLMCVQVFKEQCSANRVGMRGSTTDSKTITYDVFKKLVGKWHRITLVSQQGDESVTARRGLQGTQGYKQAEKPCSC